jgi:hypothetical protein
MAKLTNVGDVAELDEKWAAIREEARTVSYEQKVWREQVHALLKPYEIGSPLVAVTERGLLAPFVVVEVDGERRSYIVVAMEHCGKCAQPSEDGAKLWGFERRKQRLLRSSRALVKKWKSLGEDLGIHQDW